MVLATWPGLPAPRGARRSGTASWVGPRGHCHRTRRRTELRIPTSVPSVVASGPVSDWHSTWPRACRCPLKRSTSLAVYVCPCRPCRLSEICGCRAETRVPPVPARTHREPAGGRAPRCRHLSPFASVLRVGGGRPGGGVGSEWRGVWPVSSSQHAHASLGLPPQCVAGVSAQRPGACSGSFCGCFPAGSPCARGAALSGCVLRGRLLACPQRDPVLSVSATSSWLPVCGCKVCWVTLARSVPPAGILVLQLWSF